MRPDIYYVVFGWKASLLELVVVTVLIVLAFAFVGCLVRRNLRG
jgi:hypothetical protein